VLQILQRRDHGGEGRLIEGRKLLDAGATQGQQLAHTGLDVFRANLGKRR
jgi:hypothetical protein